MTPPVAGLLRDLIRIPSVNPEGDPGTGHTGELAIAKFVGDFLSDCGAEVEFHEVLPGRPNVIGRFPTDRPGKPRLLLCPHTDTVSVAGMIIDPFSGELRDGKIWGRGATDTKGSMAAMLTALKACSDRISRLAWEIWFAGLMGEEAGLHGSIDLANREHFDFVIAGEPTGMKVVHAHKGSAKVTVTSRGHSVHASTPEAGANAIDATISIIDELKREFDALAATCIHPVLGGPTLSLGTIRGGTKPNIVPDFCEAVLDLRGVPGCDMDTFLEEIASRLPQTSLTWVSSPPLHTDPGHPMMSHLASLGMPATTAPWFCDAASFGCKNVPAVALGPGRIAQAHTADEWISLPDLQQGAALFEKLVMSLEVAPLPSDA